MMQAPTPDMKEFFNYIQGNFAWALEEGMMGPSRYLVQPHNYCIPRVRYYPLTHNWFAKSIIEDMDPSLDPALVAARTEMDLAFLEEIEKIIYIFNQRLGDMEIIFRPLPKTIMHPTEFD